MFLSFRQGIVQHQLPALIQINGNHATLIVNSNVPVILTFATGITDYLWIEKKQIANAWTITPSVDQWLYWDINTTTAERTFGKTLYNPLIQATTPLSPAVDQHGFDTSTKQMKVWTGVVWSVKLRVFACKLAGGSVILSVSIEAPLFTGTQVGLITPSFSGEILFDETTNKPLRTQTGQFVTTETPINAQANSTAAIKVAALLIRGEAQQPLNGFSIVHFTNFGQINYANAFTSQTEPYGIIQVGANTGDTVIVTTTGIVSNPLWNWPAVNGLLYSDATGNLVTSPPVPGAVPVAVVLESGTVLMSPQQSPGTSVSLPTSPATTTAFGTVKINIPPAVAGNPIAVGSNDPRLTDARTPLVHTHTFPDVPGLQTALDAKVAKAGDIMSGFLTLNANPVNPLHAATKSYVDTAVGTPAITTFTKINAQGSTLTIGTPVFDFAVGQVRKANANTITTMQVFGFVADVTILNGFSGNIQGSGLLSATTSQWDAITGGVGGLIEGAIYFLNAGTAGQITTIAPTSSGQFVVIVGRAISSTILLINIENSITL